MRNRPDVDDVNEEIIKKLLSNTICSECNIPTRDPHDIAISGWFGLREPDSLGVYVRCTHCDHKGTFWFRPNPFPDYLNGWLTKGEKYEKE